MAFIYILTFGVWSDTKFLWKKQITDKKTEQDRVLCWSQIFDSHNIFHI